MRGIFLFVLILVPIASSFPTHWVPAPSESPEAQPPRDEVRLLQLPPLSQGHAAGSGHAFSFSFALQLMLLRCAVQMMSSHTF